MHLFVNEEHKQCEKMHEDNLLISEDELDSRSQGPSDFNPEQENGVVKFDIGNFVLCHRRLCHLVGPFVTCYKNFLFVIRWQSQRLSLVILVVSVYLSIRNPVYLLFVPLVYCIFVLVLAAVRNIGLNHSKGNLELLRNKFKRKEDVGNMELKRAAIKQAQEDLHAYINISIEIQEFEENLCEYIERFYRICRWEETSLSKASLLVLLFVAFTLVLLPGKYLITIVILGIFLGNPDFKEVFRHTLFQLKLWLKRWLQKLFHLQKYWLAPKSTAGTNSTKSNLNEEDTTGRANEDQWYEETVSESEVEDDIVEVDDIEDDEYEDVPSVERQKKVVCGWTKVSHFNNSRKKKKQINRGNCAACDVSFSSVLKKRQYCRHCGVSFCSRCCCKRVKRAVFGATAPAAYEETVLVCKSCYDYLMNKVDDMKTDTW